MENLYCITLPVNLGIFTFECPVEQYNKFIALADWLYEKYKDVEFADMDVHEPRLGAHPNCSKHCPTDFFVVNDEEYYSVSHEEYLRADKEAEEMNTEFIKDLFRGLSKIFPDPDVFS